MMRRVRLGRSGLMVSPLALGTLTMSPLQKDFPPQRGAELILYAAEQGINLFDTAQYYETYEPLRLALKRRPDLLVSTKSYAYDRAGAEAAFEEARQALDMDVIPIFLMHEQEDRLTLKGHREAFDFYLEQKAKGKILAVGFSTHRVAAVDYAPRYPGVDVIFPLINVTGVGIPDGTRDEMAQAIARAHSADIGIYAMKPLAAGISWPNPGRPLITCGDWGPLTPYAWAYSPRRSWTWIFAWWRGGSPRRRLWRKPGENPAA